MRDVQLQSRVKMEGGAICDMIQKMEMIQRESQSDLSREVLKFPRGKLTLRK